MHGQVLGNELAKQSELQVKTKCVHQLQPPIHSFIHSFNKCAFSITLSHTLLGPGDLGIEKDIGLTLTGLTM